MRTDSLVLRNVGPIREADIRFGDLTVLVGPQATGKSIFLQFLKLMVDRGPVFRTLKRYGLDWDRNWQDFFQLYFGEGMNGIWNLEKSSLIWQGDPIDVRKLVLPHRGRSARNAFTCRRSGCLLLTGMAG